MGSRLLRVGFVIFWALGAVAAGDAPPVVEAESPSPAPPIHGDGGALEKSVTDVVTACLRNDARAAIAGMDEITASCRKLSREEPIPRDVLLYDQALHAALGKARDLAVAKHVTESFDQFMWVMRSCRNCHEMAKRNGLYPRPTTEPGKTTP